ncbi:MAG TPA: alpha/beta hydrolase domain-containing protein [Xanthobacteraceae bacterium]|nr:alpha/beta hydrolase domain-containing protein [Xanthobacteraceae bacterium]
MSITAGRYRTALAAVAGGALLLLAIGSEARVTRITINSTTSPVFNGQMFGDVGTYEEIRGTATGEIDPLDPRNAVITDIHQAPLNANGKVEYTATFTMLKPVDMSRASGVLIYGISNRGGRALGFGNIGVTAANPAGDGFDQKPGHVYLASGWQGDLVFNPALPAETINVPVVQGVTSPTFARFVTVAGNVNTRPLPGRGRTPDSLDTTKAKLISIARENNVGERTGVVEIPSSDWAFADCSSTPFPGTPSETMMCLKNGFDPNLIYELVYIAKDPLVLGVGMAAMRDVVSFFRRAAADDVGTPNPIAHEIEWVIGYGRSQSGRYQKNFILLGFNEDEDGKIVWDGAHPIIAGQMGQFNIRFAQPGNIANIFEPGAEGPIWWGDYNDRARGRGVTGILERCRASDTCPKIFDDFGGPEIWYSRGSVGIAGTKGIEDLRLPRNVRRYYNASTTHGGGDGGFAVAQPPQPGLMLAENPNPQTETRRALLVALVDWVTKGKQPPPSEYPRVSDGTLVPATANAMHWPKIPGAPTPDNVMNVLMDYDYGPDFRYNDQSGVMTNVVPPIKQVIPTPAAKVDEDGNEIAGVKSVLLQAPLGTYTSWNPIASGPLKGNEGSLAAGYIPFAMTKTERLASGDPRRSVEERYGSQEGYDCVVRHAAKHQVRMRFLLQEDADRLIAQAAASNVLPSDPDNPIARRLCSQSD